MLDSNFDDHIIDGNINDLVSRYEAMVKGTKTSFFEEEEFEILIEHFEELHEIGKALKVSELAINQYNYSGYFLTKKAQFHYERGEYQISLALLDKALLIDVGELEIYVLRAEVLGSLERYDDAIKTLTRAMIYADDDDKYEIFILLADIYEAKEDYDMSWDYLNKVLESDFNNEEALCRIWYIVEMTGRQIESVEIHQRIIDESPYSFWAWYNLGQAFSGLGLFEHAAEAFEYSTLAKEDFGLPYRDWGEALFKLGEYRHAAQLLSKSLGMTGGNEGTYYRLGRCYEKLDTYNKARYYYRKAVHMEPGFAAAYYRIGRTYYRERRYGEASRSLSKAVKVDSEKYKYLVALASSCFNNSMVSKAILYQEKALSLKPMNLKAVLNLVKYLIADDNFEAASDILAYFRSSDTRVIYAKAAVAFVSGKNREGSQLLEEGLSTAFHRYPLIYKLHPGLRCNQIVWNIIELYN